MPSPAFTQVAFRIRNDDGDEAGATWRQNQGVNDTISGNGNFRVRFRLDETASRAWNNQTWSLTYQKNGAGGYAAVDTTTPIKVTDSSQYVEGTNCAARLTGGTGTFVTTNAGMVESSGGATNSGTAGYLFEVEFCLQIDPTQNANNDYFDLEVVVSGGYAITYSSVPRLTASIRNIDEVDGATVDDVLSNITVEVVPPGPISVQEDVTVGEEPGLSEMLVASTVDGATIGEVLAVAPVLVKSVQDGVSVGEAHSLSDMLVATALDGASIGEERTLTVESAGGDTLAINIDYHYTGVRVG